jgi:hypothetical protein
LEAFFKKYSFDLRSLALQRLSVAFVLLIDAFIRITDIEAHYTKGGVLPLGSFGGFKHIFSYFPDTAFTYYVFFTLYVVCIICFLIGYKTKVFNFICWWMLCQLHARNPYVLQGGDDLLRIALFWLMLLPTNKRWSADSYYAKTLTKANDYFSFANIGYLLLIASVYFFSALLKDSTEWRTEGTAIYYALSLDQMVLPLGKLIYPYPLLLKVLTHCVYAIELLVPIVILLPFRKWRNVGIIVLALLHLGIGSTLYVGLFFVIGIFTLPALYNGKWLDKIEQHKFYRQLFHRPKLKLEKDVDGQNSILEVAAIALIVYCLIWNLGNVRSFPYQLDASFQKIGYTLRLDQNWAMFSPTVFKDDGWYITEGITLNNDTINVLKNGVVVNYKKPENTVQGFKNDRWRKYSENLLFVDFAWLRPMYSKYLYENWNTQHNNKIKSLNLIYMKEVTGPNYYNYPIKKDLLDTYKK